jgi:hypothetical protein
MKIDTALYKNSMELSLKIKSSTTVYPRNPTSGYIAKRNKISLEDKYFPLFTEALFRIPNAWK